MGVFYLELDLRTQPPEGRKKTPEAMPPGTQEPAQPATSQLRFDRDRGGPLAVPWTRGMQVAEGEAEPST